MRCFWRTAAVAFLSGLALASYAVFVANGEVRALCTSMGAIQWWGWSCANVKAASIRRCDFLLCFVYLGSWYQAPWKRKSGLTLRANHGECLTYIIRQAENLRNWCSVERTGKNADGTKIIQLLASCRMQRYHLVIP